MLWSVIGLVWLVLAAAAAAAYDHLRRNNGEPRRQNRQLAGLPVDLPRNRRAWPVRVAPACLLMPFLGFFAVTANRAPAPGLAPAALPAVAAAPLPARPISSRDQPTRETPAPFSGSCEPLPLSTLGPHIERVAAKEGVAAELIQAVIYSESRYEPCAVSSSGAVGLMQLMPATATELGVANVLDPLENIAGGARLLRRMLTRYDGDIALAVAAYHSGPALIDHAGGILPSTRVRAYVDEILWVLGVRLDRPPNRFID